MQKLHKNIIRIGADNSIEFYDIEEVDKYLIELKKKLIEDITKRLEFLDDTMQIFDLFTLGESIKEIINGRFRVK